MIEDVGLTAKKVLIYVRMFNLLTKDVHVNLTVAALNTQEGIVTIHDEYDLVINNFSYAKCLLSLLSESILCITINTVMFKRLHHLLLKNKCTELINFNHPHIRAFYKIS